MAASIENAPEAVLAAAKEMLEKGLVEGTAGNISARMPDGNICMTPSSIDYATMTLDYLVVVDTAGKVVSGHRSPTSEKLLHLSVLNAYDDIASCIHSHACYATMFAITHQSIPACIDEFTIYVGGDVRCTEYAMSGTDELGEQAVKALEGRGAALIANHGMVAVGPSPAKALHITALVERSAQIIWGGRQIGTVVPLPDSSNETFATYYGFMRTSA